MISVEPAADLFNCSVHGMESIPWVFLFLSKDTQVVGWDEQAEQYRITILHELFPENISRAASRCILLTYSTDATRANRELLGVDARYMVESWTWDRFWSGTIQSRGVIPGRTRRHQYSGLKTRRAPRHLVGLYRLFFRAGSMFELQAYTNTRSR